MENVLHNSHFFFFGHLGDLPLPYCITYLFPTPDVFFACFFCPTVPASRKSYTYSLSLPPYRLTNFQNTVEDALHASICTEEHKENLAKAVSFTSVQITFNSIVGIGAGKVSALEDRIFRQSIHSPWTHTRFYTAVGTTKCSPLCTLTHSLKRFRTSIFKFGEV